MTDFPLYRCFRYGGFSLLLGLLLLPAMSLAQSDTENGKLTVRMLTMTGLRADPVKLTTEPLHFQGVSSEPVSVSGDELGKQKKDESDASGTAR